MWACFPPTIDDKEGRERCQTGRAMHLAPCGQGALCPALLGGPCAAAWHFSKFHFTQSISQDCTMNTSFRIQDTNLVTWSSSTTHHQQLVPYATASCVMPPRDDISGEAVVTNPFPGFDGEHCDVSNVIHTEIVQDVASSTSKDHQISFAIYFEQSGAVPVARWHFPVLSQRFRFLQIQRLPLPVVQGEHFCTGQAGCAMGGVTTKNHHAALIHACKP
mmetsp:Transcript_42878/g.67903  ORF Transcript_42878/g.67903 Transcript_42878/m.67903 type:complete len:218 (-) Transcript_42878:912-1565(-)